MLMVVHGEIGPQAGELLPRTPGGAGGDAAVISRLVTFDVINAALIFSMAIRAWAPGNRGVFQGSVARWSISSAPRCASWSSFWSSVLDDLRVLPGNWLEALKGMQRVAQHPYR